MTTSAYSCGAAYGPVTLDITSEALTIIDTTDCTLSGSTVLFPLATNTKKAVLRAAPVTFTTMQSRISFWSGFFGVSAQPDGGQIGLISQNNPTDARYVRIGDSGGTDTKLRIYDKNGNLVGTSIASISTSTQTEVCVEFNCLTLSTVFVQIFIGGVFDSAFFTGLTPANFFGGGNPMWGEILTAGVNRSANMTAHDFTVRYTANSALASHLTAFPRLKVYGGANLAATKEGNSTGWTALRPANASPNTWKEIAATSDFPNDGDTSGLTVAVTSTKHLFRWGDGTAGFVNPVSGLTIDAVYQDWVHRLISGGKSGNDGLWRLNGSETVITASSAPSTSYVGNYGPTTFDGNRPGGGAFVSTDFDLRGADNYSELEFGVDSANAGTVSVDVTEIPGPIIIAYANTLPLGIVPYAPAAIMVPTNQPIFNPVRVVAI